MAIRKKNLKRDIDTAPAEAEPVTSTEPQFPIIGLGASVGGLEAFTELLRALPDPPGMVFVLVQHQEPKHSSMLTQILARTTSMHVRQIVGDELLEANNVYVAPPDAQRLEDD